MSVQEKIAHIKDKAAKLAVKAAAVATMMTGAGVAGSCAEDGANTDETKEKTSVVFRSIHNSYRYDTDSDILTENGDELHVVGKGCFLEPGDTITYETDNMGITKVKAARYKNGNKNVNFGKIGKIGKDITD